MGEENSDKAVPAEDTVPENGDLTKNTGSLVDEASDNNDEHRAMDGSVATSESTESIGDTTSDAVHEECTDLRPNNQTPDGMIGHTSPSSTTDSAGPSKRNPTAVPVGSDHKFTVRSRYRRASIGSCHDLCKGHKHEPEKVTKRPFLGTIKEGRALVRAASGDNLAKRLPEKETKNKAVRRLSLPGSVPVKDPPAKTKGTDSSTKATPAQPKLKAGQGELRPPSVPAPEGSVGRTKVDIPSVKKATQERSNRKVKEITTKEAGSSSESKKVKARETMMNSASITLKKSPSIKARLYKNLRSFSRSRLQNNSEDVKINESQDVSEKEVHIPEANPDSTLTQKALKSSLSNEETPTTQKESRAGKARKSNVSKKGTRFSLSSFSSPSTSKSSASTAKRTAKPQGEYQQKSNPANTKQIGTVTEEGGSKSNTPRAKPTANLKTKAKKTVVSRPEEKDGSSWKVKFRRGTVVNIQAASNSPRKLRFKKGRVVGEDQNAKAEGQSLKNTDDRTNESPDTVEPEKVHLRRQEASGKKDNIDLNNVIEETASKLVKTRKSKVKALVGAFETVMSFRDRKPLVETRAS